MTTTNKKPMPAPAMKAAQTLDAYGGTTHYRRRMEAKRRFPGVPVDDVIAPGHATTPDEYMEPAA